MSETSACVVQVANSLIFYDFVAMQIILSPLNKGPLLDNQGGQERQQRCRPRGQLRRRGRHRPLLPRPKEAPHGSPGRRVHLPHKEVAITSYQTVEQADSAARTKLQGALNQKLLQIKNIQKYHWVKHREMLISCLDVSPDMSLLWL
jgi:hypothetical protein